MATVARLLAAALLFTSARADAQSSPAAARLEFEVASIRVNTVGGPAKKVGDPATPVRPGVVVTVRSNRFAARNATLRALVRFAYGSDGDLATPPLLEEYRVVGGPSWIDTEAFDIVAMMPEAANRAVGDSALMLRALLAERFALNAHTETRELPAYALVRARSDGRPGPELRVSSGQCVPRTNRAGRDQIPCGARGAFQGIIANGTSMTQLAATLAPILGVMVVDRTALPGTFDFNVRFTDGLSSDARFPSVFTALQEQLGLKLESTRALADVVVIDDVRRPTGN
jgi:uncharacterized protein (TIGR03435 family)